MTTHFDVADLALILSHWFGAISGETLLAHQAPGGLSGAKIWYITHEGHKFCLRRWPARHPTPDQLRTIHQGIEHVWRAGLPIVPVPYKTRSGDTFLDRAGHLWELSPWLAGEPLNSFISNKLQRTVAVEALVKFHMAVRNFGSASHSPPCGPAPGLLHRQEMLSELLAGHHAELSQAVSRLPPTPLREIMLRLLTQMEHALPRTFAFVEKCSKVPLPLQWCLRDVHPGNLLLSENQVTGIVDFAAAAIDSVAGDIARLVGGFNCDPQERQAHLSAYAEIRPLTVEERRAIGAYQAGGLIAAAANWIRWLAVENSIPLADTTQARLEQLAEEMGRIMEF